MFIINKVTLKSYPKINLFLNIINKRNDGFHNILTLFKSVYNYYDEIDIELSEKEEFKSNYNFDFNWKDNIIKKTIDIFKKETSINNFNLKIYLNKKLPLGGGLGGGSSNAATILNFLSKIFNISNKDIFLIASKIGSDVPFLTKGGMAIGEGKGEILHFLDDIDLKIELKFFNINSNTKEMYEYYSVNKNHLKLSGDPYLLYESLLTNDYSQARKNAYNIFENILFLKYPLLEKQKNYYNNEKNTIFSLMTGSGSTIYKLFKKEEFL